MFMVIGLAPVIALADLPPPTGFHSPGLCAKIVNLDQFPNVVLVGYNYGPVSTVKPYVIKNNECLVKGYKFTSLDILWTTKDKFNLVDLDNLNLGIDGSSNSNYKIPTDMNLLLKSVETMYFGELIPDTNPLIKGTIEYSLYEIPDDVLGFALDLYKSKQISEYNNGTSPKVETFSNSNPTSYNFGTVTLRSGSRGEAVMELQRFLNRFLNLGLVVDGKLGPKTIAVIKQWQRDNGLVADGLVGVKTKAKMNQLVQ